MIKSKVQVTVNHIKKGNISNIGKDRELLSASLKNDTALKKAERGERSANKEMIPVLAELFKEDKETLGLILLSDKVAHDLRDEVNPNENP